MCLIFLAIDSRPDKPFVLLANRDEFYIRPTADMHWWEDVPVLAGKDFEAGGTWLAYSRNGRLAAVTNYRDMKHVRPNAPSRGRIPLDVVQSKLDGVACIESLRSEWKDCNGFNLLFHDGKSTFWYSNVTDEVKELQPGVYGLSNALLDTPWPKVETGKKRFEAWLQKDELQESDAFEIMADTARYAQEELPDTGVGMEMEALLSSICITSPIYGTRCSTFIVKDSIGKAQVWEKNILTGEVRQFEG
jgi:uncharacterized protein with NRDE domain